MNDPVGAGRAAAALSYVTRNSGASAVAIAEPRWRGLAGVPGAERARYELARALSAAEQSRGNLDSNVQYAGQMILLAEALDDAEAQAAALAALGTSYNTFGAPRVGAMLLERSAATAREHDLPLPLTRALTNLAAISNCRDLAAALRAAQQARDVARRAGLQRWVEAAGVNAAINLWFAGRLTEAAELVADGVLTTDLGMRVTWCMIEVWLAEACGDPIPAPRHEADTDSEPDLAWLRSADVARAVAVGDHGEATRLAPLVLGHLLAASGIDDDFFLLWPPLVLAALGAGDLELAERLLDPVTTALPGQRSPAVTAQWHRLRGLLAAAHGDDPRLAETELRAGVDALAAFGAVGFHAQAQEELAHWLVTQRRDDEAAPLLDAARATYAEIGAIGWLSRLDERQTTRSADGHGLPRGTVKDLDHSQSP